MAALSRPTRTFMTAILVVLALAMPLSLLVMPPSASAQESKSANRSLLLDYQNWNMVTFGDAQLHAESDAAVAVGGTLSFSGTNIAAHGYTGNGGIGVLAQNIDLRNSNGTLQVLAGSIRLGNPVDVKILNRDQNNATVHTRAVASDASYDSTPSVATSSSNEDGRTVIAHSLFRSLFSQQTARQLAQSASTDGQGINALSSTSGSSTTLTLTQGRRNYWKVDGTELSRIRELKFSGAAPSVANGTFLIAVVDGTQVTFNMTMAGSRDPSAILWDAPQAGNIIQSGDSLDGSILAPDAHLEKTSANINGTIIVNSADLKGSEQHYYPYEGPTPSTPSSPTTPQPTSHNRRTDPPTTPIQPVTRTPKPPAQPNVPPTPPTPAAPITPTHPAALTNPAKPTSPPVPAKPVRFPADGQAKSEPPVHELASTGSTIAPMIICALLLLLVATTLIVGRLSRSTK